MERVDTQYGPLVSAHAQAHTQTGCSQSHLDPGIGCDKEVGSTFENDSLVDLKFVLTAGPRLGFGRQGCIGVDRVHQPHRVWVPAAHAPG